MLVNLNRFLKDRDEVIRVGISQKKANELYRKIDSEIGKVNTDGLSQEDALFLTRKREAEINRRFSEEAVDFEEPLTLKIVLLESLKQPADDDNLSVKNFELTLKIANQDEIELDSNEIQRLRKLIASRYSVEVEKKKLPNPVIHGQASLMLEGKL